MMEMADTAPDVSVHPAEYQRLLGYPPDHELSDRARELAQWARGWYAQHGRPWIYARSADVAIGGDVIELGGASFHSQRLREILGKAGAHAVFLVATGAGEALELEARRLWEEGKPDEYFFLEVFGSAVVEHLTHATGARLCAWAEERGMAVLPHYSPGYPEWDIAEQGSLLALVAGTGKLPGRLDALSSGALRPKKSQLAVFGFTRHTDRVQRLTELNPCENCPCLGCQYRRVPNRNRKAAQVVSANGSAGTFQFISANGIAAAPANGAAAALSLYTIKTKALKRWAAERLSLRRRPDGAIEALFRYEGTTCTNMGRPMTFDYQVTLDPRDGYRIREQRCAPAPDDTGHTYMCRYLDSASELMGAIASEKPLLGQPLSAALKWSRPEIAPGCYCEASSRHHKWGIVLETIHYALSQENRI